MPEDVGSSRVVQTRKWGRFALIVGGAITADIMTKYAIVNSLLMYQQVDVIGSYLRLTYIHNAGAAFGISAGVYSRALLAVLGFIALAALTLMFSRTPAQQRGRLNAIALICGGAIGNLGNRIVIRSGVVDWIDVGVGSVRWPVFNVADIAVTLGAVFLATSLWREEAAEPSRVRATGLW
jgi:signal peptidase II